MIEQVFFVFATAVNLVAAFWIIGALFTKRLQRMPAWHRVGLTVGAIGLLAQAMRNIQFLVTGVSAADSELPLWFLKDLGYGLIAFHSMWLVFSGQLVLNEPVKTEPVKRKPAAKKTAIKK